MASVVASVVLPVESDQKIQSGEVAGLSVRLLGPLTVLRGGVPVALPASRKLRALLAYLALTPHAVGRSRLCELLWDVPNDPRGELRWCLSKLRGVLDDPDVSRIETQGDTVALRLDGVSVDVVEIAAAAAAGIGTLGPERLRALSDLFAGDFLDGLELDRCPHFDSWLVAQRRRFTSCHIAILEHLVNTLPAGSDASPYLDKWLELAPFDVRAHVALLENLARRGQIGQCEEHLVVAAQLFQSEELEFAPVREAWRAIKDRQSDAAPGAKPAIAFAPQVPIALADTGCRRIAPGLACSHAVCRGRRYTTAIRGGLADGMTHDIITRLAKLRDFFVIARGSMFALAEQNIAPEDAGRRLNVDYVASGTVRNLAGRVIVSVELIEVRTARIVWAETFERKPDDIFIVLDDIGNSIVSSIAAEIAMVERNRAMLKAPNSLNAWEAYHRGLWHMYRFTRRGERTGPAVLRHGLEAGSDLRPRLCRPLIHPLAERLPALGRSRPGNRACLRKRRPEPAGRRPQPRRPLGHGPGAVAARRTGRIACSSWNGLSTSARTSRSAIMRCPSCNPSRATRKPRSAHPTIRAISAPSTRCCSA